MKHKTNKANGSLTRRENAAIVIKGVSLCFYLLFILVWSIGCDTGPVKAEPSVELIEKSAIRSPVTTIAYVPAKTGSLTLRQFVNGRIAAFDKVEIKFEASGRIMSADLKNGQAVKKGSVMARLDDRDLKYELAAEELVLETAINDRNERMMLVSGGDFGDSSVTIQQKQYIDIVSGYNKAVQAIEETRHQLTKTMVVAPFDGLVADLKVKQSQYVGTGEVLCTLINPSSYEAQFSVTEALAIGLKTGQTVAVSPLADPDGRVSSRITAINPLVDDNGLVQVNARLSNRKQGFFEGMNVRVAIEQNTPPSILVPKNALVLRSGREVVFTYASDEGRAKWNYVTVAYENDDYLGITKGLDAGDLVIVEGNLNLDHDAKVEHGNDE